MAITAELVKALRDRTGAGMMDCKTALTEAGGDMEQAIDILRKKGLAQAQKKAGRSTNEGLIAHLVTNDARVGVLVEVNCESDFVARTDEFQALMRNAATAVAGAGAQATDEWLTDPKGVVQPLVAAAIGKLGENMAITRFARFETATGYIGQYIHLGGKLGVMVEVEGGGREIAQKDEFKTLVKEIAMQVAAASPVYVSRDQVHADVLEREKDIYRAQMAGQNKPANVIEKIIEGKLGAFYQQVVLPDQPAIRDPKMTVAQLIAATSTSLGAEIKVTRFARLKVGETA